jgi:hypothetical protein
MFDPYYLKEISYKNLYFTIFNNFKLFGDIGTFFNGHKNAQVGSGSVNNWPSGSGYIITDNGPAGLDPKDRSTN